MNLQFIKYFVVLSETGNFTQAAEKVHVVQSAFSSGIKKLERDISCKLFYRSNREVLLTEEGKQLLPKAKQLLSLWHEMEGAFSEDYAKPLKLGVVEEIDFHAIAPLLKRFHELYPNHEVQVVEKTEAELQQLLKSGGIDACFMKYIPFDHHALNFRLLREDPLVMAVPESHPYSAKKKVSIHELHGQALVERTNCSLYGEVEKVFQEQQIKPNIVFRAKGDEMAKALVASGIGVSLVPKIETEYPNIRYLPISDASFLRKLFLVWNKDRVSEALKRLGEV